MIFFKGRDEVSSYPPAFLLRRVLPRDLSLFSIASESRVQEDVS